MVPSTDGLGYRSEQKIEPKVPVIVDLADPTVDLAAVRAEKRRREIEAMSSVRSIQEIDEVFSSNGASDLDAAAERLGQPAGGRVSLREQLRLNKEAQDAAWQEKHNPFKPPPGLSEEDYNMFMQLEEDRMSKHAAQREQEAEDYKAFAKAVQSKQQVDGGGESVSKVDLKDLDTIDPALSFARTNSPGASLLVDGASATATSEAATPAMPVFVLKRKHSTDGGAAEHKEKKHKKHKKHKKDKDDTPPPTTTSTSSSSTTNTATTPVASAPAATSALAGLVAYSSDEDE